MENNYLIIFDDGEDKRFSEYVPDSNLVERITSLDGDGYLIISVNLVH